MELRARREPSTSMLGLIFPLHVCTYAGPFDVTALDQERLYIEVHYAAAEPGENTCIGKAGTHAYLSVVLEMTLEDRFLAELDGTSSTSNVTRACTYMYDFQKSACRPPNWTSSLERRVTSSCRSRMAAPCMTPSRWIPRRGRASPCRCG